MNERSRPAPEQLPHSHSYKLVHVLCMLTVQCRIENAAPSGAAYAGTYCSCLITPHWLASGVTISDVLTSTAVRLTPPCLLLQHRLVQASTHPQLRPLVSMRLRHGGPSVVSSTEGQQVIPRQNKKYKVPGAAAPAAGGADGSGSSAAQHHAADSGPQHHPGATTPASDAGSPASYHPGVPSYFLTRPGYYNPPSPPIYGRASPGYYRAPWEDHPGSTPARRPSSPPYYQNRPGQGNYGAPPMQDDNYYEPYEPYEHRSPTDSPDYYPTSPTYSPYSPTSPTYFPDSPTYAPTSARYAPDSPTYAPTVIFSPPWPYPAAGGRVQGQHRAPAAAAAAAGGEEPAAQGMQPQGHDNGHWQQRPRQRRRRQQHGGSQGDGSDGYDSEDDGLQDADYALPKRARRTRAEAAAEEEQEEGLGGEDVDMEGLGDDLPPFQEHEEGPAEPYDTGDDAPYDPLQD